MSQEMDNDEFLENLCINATRDGKRAEVAEKKLEDLSILITDIEYQCSQAHPHPALLGITATLNTIKKILK